MHESLLQGSLCKRRVCAYLARGEFDRRNQIMRVLLVEDDEYLATALALALKRKGYNVEIVRTSADARRSLASSPIDLVLLDLGLPDADGSSLLAGLRTEGIDLPVIIITARDSIEARIEGLDSGANDYLVKPFDFRELEARMRAALRKSKWNNKVEIEFGPLILNTNSGQLLLKGQQTDLTPKEFAVLQAPMVSAGKVISKRKLMEEATDLWGDEPSENAIEIVIHRLRKKLDLTGIEISTVRGFGYMLAHREK